MSGYMTGYFAGGTTTDRTKVHIVRQRKTLCGFVPRGRKTEFLWCAMGIKLDYCECKRCKDFGSRILQKLSTKKP